MSRIIVFVMCFILVSFARQVFSDQDYLVFTGSVIDVEYADSAEVIPECYPGSSVRYVFALDFNRQGYALSKSGKVNFFNNFTTSMTDVRYFYSKLVAGNIIDDPLGYFKRPGVDYVASNNFGFQYDFINDFSDKPDVVRLVAGNSNDELTVEINGLIPDLKPGSSATAWYSTFDADGNQRIVSSELMIESVTIMPPEGVSPDSTHQ